MIDLLPVRLMCWFLFHAVFGRAYSLFRNIPFSLLPGSSVLQKSYMLDKFFQRIRLQALRRWHNSFSIAHHITLAVSFAWLNSSFSSDFVLEWLKCLASLCFAARGSMKLDLIQGIDGFTKMETLMRLVFWCNNVAFLGFKKYVIFI